MKQFVPDKYEQLFENWNDPIMIAHAKYEKQIILGVKNSLEKTFIDLGAGYGRMLPVLTKVAMNVIAIEIDNEMFSVLKTRSTKYKNIKAINGDITKLSSLVKKEKIKNPVLVLLQNTLGTIEGHWQKVLAEMKSVVKKYKGELVISVYRQPALKEWGIMTYWHGKDMNGEPDFEKTDFNKGLFISKTNYRSKWWTDDEIKQMKEFLGGKIIQEVLKPEYYILHAKL